MAYDFLHIVYHEAVKHWYARWIAVLILIMSITWVGQQLWVSHVAETVASRRVEMATRALDRISENYAAVQSDMLVQARTISERRDVISSLRRYTRQRDSEAREPLVRLFAREHLSGRSGLELWDLTPQLISWSGLSMPLDEGPGQPKFLESPQSALARDEDKRIALVLWYPVRDGARVLGTVRVTHLIYAHMPVRNKYLKDIDLSDDWSGMVGLPVQIDYASPSNEESESPGLTRILRGINGVPQLWITVSLPTTEALIQGAHSNFENLITAMLSLLLMIFVLGLWRWYCRCRAELSASATSPISGKVMLSFGLWASSWWGLRFLFIAVNVPGRWQGGRAPFAAAFDPVHLASTVGGGLMQSTGDLFVSALFALIFAGGFLHLSMQFPSSGVARMRLRDRLHHHREGRNSLARLFIMSTAAVSLQCGLVMLLALVTRHTIFDSTLDFFSRTGLLPKPLVLVVFCALMLTTLSVALLSIGLTRMTLGLMRWTGPVAGSLRWWIVLVLASVGMVVSILYLSTDIGLRIPLPGLLGFLFLGVGGAAYGMLRGMHGIQMLTLRSVLVMVFLLALLLYPLVFKGLETQRREGMLSAAESFEDEESPRMFFALGKVLEKRDNPRLRALIQTHSSKGALDSLCLTLLRGSLLVSRGEYDVSLTVLDSSGHPLGRHDDAAPALSRASLDKLDSIDFSLMHDMYVDGGAKNSLVQPITGRLRSDRQQYAGIAPIRDLVAGRRIAWLMVRADPRLPYTEGNRPFPSVLLPSGDQGNRHSEFSTAAFRNGVLVRSEGRNFGRYRLPEDVSKDLLTSHDIWRTETVKEERYLTYFHRSKDVSEQASRGVGPVVDTRTVAVRTITINTFDHLYYLLRLTVAGLVVGLPIYLLGLYFRRRRKSLDAPREHFRDKVLNAFFAVGLITAAAMGLAGLQVVSGENERAIQSWLQQHLERVEETLAREARGEELPYRVLSRIRTDSLALQVGLDLNIYRDGYLVDSSRPQLIYDRLIQDRLPAEVYLALYYDGFRFTFARQEVGNFVYTAGYRALSDERGVPRVVISVPTLPEQERIEEEKARTVAYLFGALLLLVFVVVLTAGLLANALARPIARLREGLEAVAQGRFEKIRPIGTRDEIGELVETFNEMQGQLAESRRKVARQERQLAWREMARQVAHEIKNPLTPMRLKVQHLQVAFEALSKENHSGQAWQRFRSRFLETTPTLLEQIDALVRIAREFSTFARMPKISLEPMDLNAVILEAVTLMQDEVDCKIECELSSSPLVLMADRQELRRIFINLIKNAFQAIPQKGVCRLEITSEQQLGDAGAEAFATITDTGAGIPPELRDKIFEPNFSTKTSGTGLGLAIVRQGVDALNGKIGFDTEVGVGTTFWLRLPLVE